MGPSNKKRRTVQFSESLSPDAKSSTSPGIEMVAKSSDFTASYPQIQNEIRQAESLKSFDEKISYLKAKIIEAATEGKFVRAGELAYYARAFEIKAAKKFDFAASSNAASSTSTNGQIQQMPTGPPNLMQAPFGGLNQIQ